MSKTITPRALAARLRSVQPANVPAVRLLLELRAAQESEAQFADYVQERRAEIEAALSGLERQLEAMNGVARRCQELPPVPSKCVPAGI